MKPVSDQDRLVRDLLRRALDRHRTNLAVTSILDRLAVLPPERLAGEVITLLCEDPGLPGIAFVVVNILEDPTIYWRLVDPVNVPRESALTLSRQFLLIDSIFDIKLARQLPGRYGQPGAFDIGAVPRILDILDKISHGPRLIPLVGHLARHPDPRVSSKASMLVGSRLKNPAWVAAHLLSPDPRVRANVIEALWGNATASARNVFLAYQFDPHHRVAGNAIVGLHLMGESDINAGIVRLVKHSDARFRSTAAWVMSLTGKLEFTDDLHRLMQDEASTVRSAAIRALSALHKAAPAASFAATASHSAP